MCLSVCLSAVTCCVSTQYYLNVSFFSVCLSVHLSVCLSVCLCVCLSVCVSVYLSVCLSICLCCRSYPTSPVRNRSSMPQLEQWLRRYSPLSGLYWPLEGRRRRWRGTISHSRRPRHWERRRGLLLGPV